MKNIIVEGHRGWAARYPENTLLSFQKAIELGVDAIEFDVWLSKDKVPVLMHDGSPYRTCDVEGHLRDMTLAEIRALDPCYAKKFGETFRGQVAVPTLRELLELRRAIAPGIKLGVEIKEYTEENVDLTVALLHEFDCFDDCWFYAFNGRIIRYLREQYNARTMGYPDFQMKEFDGYDAYAVAGLVRNHLTVIRFAHALIIRDYLLICKGFLAFAHSRSGTPCVRKLEVSHVNKCPKCVI